MRDYNAVLMVYGGFEGIEALKSKLGNVKLPVDLDCVKQYEKDWKTAIFSKEGEILVKDNSSKALLVTFAKSNMLVGQWYSPMKKDKEWVVGRDDDHLYYVSIKPDGKCDRRDMEVEAPETVSRIHFYAKDLGETLQITRLGQNPLDIEVEGLADKMGTTL